MWLPATAKLPPPPLMVPADVAPSPQLIVADRLPGVSPAFGSLTDARVALSAAPAVPVSDLPPDTVIGSAMEPVAEKSESMENVVLCPLGRVEMSQLSPMPLSSKVVQSHVSPKSA